MGNEALIMLDAESKKTIPINEGLFTIAQFSREKKLNKKYAGNKVIYPSGDVKEIISIKILGYFGDSFFTKLFSILNSTYKINVQLANSKASFQEILEQAFFYLKNDQESDEPYMPRQDLSILVASRISSPVQLYAMLKLPRPEDCLDVMV